MKRLIIGLALVAAGMLVFAACAEEEEEAPTPAATNTPRIVEIPPQPPTSTKPPATQTAIAALTATAKAKAAGSPAAATATKPAATAAATAAATKAAAGDAAKGKTVWDANCNACHPGGAKGVGPAVTGTKLTDAELTTITKSGKGAMPAYASLSADDITNMIAYIRTLK